MESIALVNQWNDFLIRQYDPYALAKYEILISWMGDLSKKSVMVVGCGSGEFCAMLAQRGAHVSAIDVEDAPLVLTSATAEKFGVSVKTWVAQIETVSTEIKYDFVVATDVIEHIRDDEAAIFKLHALTKPYGLTVITVPASQRLFGYHDEILGHFRRYSRRSLLNLLSPHFDVKKIRYFGFFLVPVTFLVSCLLRRPYPMMVVEQSRQKNTLFRKFLSFLFRTQKTFNLGLGTSLLLMARPRIQD